MKGDFPIDGLWAGLDQANMIPELQLLMGEIVKRIMCEMPPPSLVDLVLARCGTRPIFFEHGMTIVMIATPEARERFRARMVECGEFSRAARLGVMMDRPLSREEVVRLGNNYDGGYIDEEAKQFLAYAEKTVGILELDLRRLRRQLFEEEHIWRVS